MGIAIRLKECKMKAAVSFLWEHGIFLKEKTQKEQLDRAEKDLKAFDELKTWLRIALNIQNIYDNIHRVEEKIPAAVPIQTAGSNPASAVGLQKVTKIVDLQEYQLKVPTISTDTVKGKILLLAKEGFFTSWRNLGEVNKQLQDRAWTCASSAVSQNLGELVDTGILGVKRTDRNEYKLAPDVVFEGKEEVS